MTNLPSEAGNPTGLRVEFASIPEPSVVSLFAVSLAACCIKRFARHRRDSVLSSKLFRSIGGIVMWGACGSVCFASEFVNGSFEAPATYFKVLYTGETIPGWTVLGGTVDLYGYGLWQPSNGEMSVDMVGTPARGAIAQTLQFDNAGAYYLTFDISRNPNINYGPVSMGIWANGPPFAEFEGLGMFTFDKPNQTSDRMWQRMGTESFTVGPGATTFVFAALTGGGGVDTANWGGAALDNVKLVAGISPYSPQRPPPLFLPEPVQGHYTVYDNVGPGGVAPEPTTLVLLVVASPFLISAVRKETI